MARGVSHHPIICAKGTPFQGMRYGGKAMEKSGCRVNKWWIRRYNGVVSCVRRHQGEDVSLVASRGNSVWQRSLLTHLAQAIVATNHRMHLASWALIFCAWYPDATATHLAQHIFLLMHSYSTHFHLTFKLLPWKSSSLLPKQSSQFGGYNLKLTYWTGK